MKLINKKFGVFLIIICCLVIGIRAMPHEQLNENIKIGVSNDTSGIVIDYMIKTERLNNAELDRNFEPYSIKDWWASTAQWALSADVLDLAIVCKEAAGKFIENDSRFEIVGPCVKNSDIFVLREGIKPKKIGLTQNRVYQEQLVKNTFGKECEIVPTMAAALPYVLEKDRVDGIVVDAVKGMSVSGVKQRISKEDYVTYVLVVRKDFKEKPIFNKFIKLYNDSVNELQLKDVLFKQLRSYIDKSISIENINEWSKWRVEFLEI